jgi:hypothetical protein
MKEMVGLPAPAPSILKGKHAEINIFTVASGLLYEVSRVELSPRMALT